MTENGSIRDGKTHSTTGLIPCASTCKPNSACHESEWFKDERISDAHLRRGAENRALSVSWDQRIDMLPITNFDLLLFIPQSLEKTVLYT